jgi:hypothetical protein
LYTLIFIDEDSDLIVREFSSLEGVKDFESHFEDEPKVDSGYWEFGYEPKHVIVEGKVVKNRT